MDNTQEGIFKILSEIGTMATTAWGFVAQVQKRFNQIRDINERGGEQGPFFFITYTIFQYVYAVALILCGLVGLGALVGGVAEIVNSPEGLPYLTSFFDMYGFHVLGLAILLFIAAAVNALSWIPISLLGCIPAKFLALKQSAAWYNLWQFSIPLGAPNPLFINPTGVSALADIAISGLETTNAGRENFAETPTQLCLHERANAALIGCILEKEYGIRQWPKPKWGSFYAAVAAAEADGKRLVSPKYLATAALNVDFYGVLSGEVNSRLPEDEPGLPDSAEARDDVSNAVKILVDKYKGSAKNLATVWWSRKPNLRVAFSRAQSIRPLDSRSMVPQFIKLAVRWEVWPGAKLGNFIYPYAPNLGVLLFEKHALVTLPGPHGFAFQDKGQLAAFRETMRRTVTRVRKNLSSSKKPEHRNILTRYPTEWQLAAGVDFVLWAHSSQMKEHDRFQEWKLDENSFVTRKGGSGALSSQGT